MTWGVITDVAAPIEMYDAAHAELVRTTGGNVEGLLVHVARQTREGFQVIEVWDSRESFDAYHAEVVLPVLQRLSSGGPPPAQGAPQPEEFEVRGLVLPHAGIVR